MRFIFISIGIWLSAGIGLNAQTLDSLVLYETTDAFLKRSPVVPYVKAEIIEVKPNCLMLHKFRDISTDKKIKYGKLSWSFNYLGNDYFNMIYCNDYYLPSTFYKMDIVGRYCVILIDENEKIFMNDIHFGAGLTNVLISEYEKSRNKKYYWYNKSGKKVNIILIDTNDIERSSVDRNKGSSGNYVSKTKLFKILKPHNPDLNVEFLGNLLIEDIMEMISELNKVYLR